jgi:prevent-host-death family protein
MSSEYEAVPLSDLRDRLGKVVAEVSESGRPVVVTQKGRDAVVMVPASVLEAGSLPPAYFDERARLDTIARLDAKIAERTPEEVAAAQAWLRELNAVTGTGAAGAA